MTVNNQGPLINIIAWVSLVAVCLATSVKLGVKYATIRSFGQDDAYMLGAMVSFCLIVPKTIYTHAI